jgi:alpha-amylase/alpha-mannosidase (GH57 family)
MESSRIGTDTAPSRPLNVAILWHQHQPYYKLGNSYLLPWARLHATKDYHDIIAALDDFPNIRQTVNVVPSLLIQLIDYVENGATDTVLELSRKPADSLTTDEQVTVLRSFFLCNAERMIFPYPRFLELYHKGNRDRNDIDALAAAAAEFTTQDWLDLQVWYNLTWIGELSRREEPFVSLLQQGGNFTEEDKHNLLDASMAIIARIIPKYRQMMESGQIELSVTPYYHPILPILCNSYSALEAMPNASLPEHHIAYPEDALTHLRRAVTLYQDRFGRTPEGMWPSEGSISDEAMNLVRSVGITWAASDEGVLRKTLGEEWNDLKKYFPYTLKTRNGPLWLLFRDHALSDAIGFVYSNWDPKGAAADFYNRLVEVRSKIIQQMGPSALNDAIVPVILDGENCWEYYEQNGQPFLEELYALLSQSSEIRTTTIADALRNRRQHPARTLGRIYSGSWIGSNFKIWIGHVEDNSAWDALAEARETLLNVRDTLDPAKFDEAMEEIYIAEGSDWFWWFGDENSAANQDDFDDLFRAHLRNVYQIIGLESPASLDIPIRHAARVAAVINQSGPISPTIDGRRFPDDEWLNAGHFSVARVGGAMHRSEALERRVWFGQDDTTLYLRFDLGESLQPGNAVRLQIHGQSHIVIHFAYNSIAIEAALDQHGVISMAGMTGAIGEVIEAAVPLKHLMTGDGPLDSVGIVCEIFEQGHETERFPHQGEIVCSLGPVAESAIS